ncbi:hypothetical protein EDD15DRAFT_2310743, partial [Pisolithus albus]
MWWQVRVLMALHIFFSGRPHSEARTSTSTCRMPTFPCFPADTVHTAPHTSASYDDERGNFPRRKTSTLTGPIFHPVN